MKSDWWGFPLAALNQNAALSFVNPNEPRDLRFSGSLLEMFSGTWALLFAGK
jgi:hypothetical protein